MTPPALVLALIWAHVVTAHNAPFIYPSAVVSGLPQGGLDGVELPGFGNGGGPMIRHPAVTTLAWGRDKNGEIVRWFESINSFLFDLPATSYAAWIDKEYSTRHLKLGRGRFVRDLVLIVDFKPTITQRTIENKLKQLISQKILPLNADGNALTIILVPPGVSVRRDGVLQAPIYSCIDFCAYRRSFDFRKKKHYYIVIPDQSCSGIKSKHLDCENGLPHLDAMTRTISLQYFNAKTNPAGADTEFTGPSVGWFARNWGDIGSPCVTMSDRIAGPTGVTWTVNQIWSARNTSCLTTPSRPRLVRDINSGIFTPL